MMMTLTHAGVVKKPRVAAGIFIGNFIFFIQGSQVPGYLLLALPR
jgi:quinol-cytochrome oxidoreductase complex cytochrome b subunit